MSNEIALSDRAAMLGLATLSDNSAREAIQASVKGNAHHGRKHLHLAAEVDRLPDLPPKSSPQELSQFLSVISAAYIARAYRNCLELADRHRRKPESST